MLRHLFGDIRYAARRLAATPGFTAAAVITIALGVGINTGFFSVLNALAFRDLAAGRADELVTVHQTLDETSARTRSAWGTPSRFSTSEYRAYRDGTRTLSGIAGYSDSWTVTLGGDVPQEIAGAYVTCNYFEVLQQRPALGPGFASDCDAEGATPTVVLGHEVWTTAFSAHADIVGREVVLNRQSFVVVGVAPEGVRGVDFLPVQFFAPIAAQPLLGPPVGDIYRDARGSWLTLIGRKAADANLEQIRAELRVIAARIDSTQAPRETALAVDRARRLSPDERSGAIVGGSLAMTAFGLVLLIACANVANLLVARATGRTREIAVRLSLGASRARIVQQLLAESLLIAAVGGALGALLTLWTVGSLVHLAIASLPPQARGVTIETVVDARVLAFAIATTLASGVLFGLAPALHASKPDLHSAMKVDVSGMGRRSGGRLQAVLVGVQVAVCMVLTISAGLLVRSLYETQTVEPGFEYENVAVASFKLSGAGYDAPRAAEFQRQLAERVAAQPGIEGVAQAGMTPLYPGRMGFTGRVPGQEPWLQMSFNWVSPSYFSLISIPIVRGRTFTDAELAEGGAIIVTEATARRLWPDRDPVGQTFEYAVSNVFAPPVQTIDLTVVGVTGDAQITGIGEVTSNYVYLPAGARSQMNLQLLAKSAVDFAATAAGIRSIAAELDPGLVVNVEPLEANLDFWRSLSGLVSTIAASLGTLALVLASVGVYGVVAYAVGRRAREIGIRMALGATASSVVKLMLKRTMRPVVFGAAIGVAVALGASQILSFMLYGVSPVDPIALLGAVAVVTGVALAAGGLPARRAARVDPSRTLHYE